MSKLDIDQIKDKALPILKKAGVKKSSIFGSYLHGNETKKSDIDILVDLPEEMSLFDVIRLKRDLEKVLNKKVDLVEYSTIKPRIKNYIINNHPLSF